MRRRRSRPKSYFARVKCQECGNEQVIYSHASRPVSCLICGEPLARPKGGRAEILAPVLGVYGRVE